VKKNDDRLIVPDPDAYPRLLIAFKATAEGKSNREIAVIPNAAGCLTSGNRGQNPFRKDTVSRVLMLLPWGSPGWRRWLDAWQPLADA